MTVTALINAFVAVTVLYIMSLFQSKKLMTVTARLYVFVAVPSFEGKVVVPAQ